MDFDTWNQKYGPELQKIRLTPRTPEVLQAAKYILLMKDRYLAVQATTGVPWRFIGALHYREASGRFDKHLHNGDSLAHKTVHEPAGRPPGPGPWTWQQSAEDALKHDGLAGTHTWDWSLARIGWAAEQYNGPGYSLHGVPSPYVFGGTSLQKVGKYIEDGPQGWRPNIWDDQPGVLAIILGIEALESDQGIQKSQAGKSPPEETKVKPQTAPPVSSGGTPATRLPRPPDGFIRGLLWVIAGLFKKDNNSS